MHNLPKPGTYLELKRTWKTGDTIALVLPKRLRAEPLPDNPRRMAMMLGPLVLAGDLGPERARAHGHHGHDKHEICCAHSLVLLRECRRRFNFGD